MKRGQDLLHRASQGLQDLGCRPGWHGRLLRGGGGHRVVTRTVHDASSGCDSHSPERKHSAVRPRASLRMGCSQPGRELILLKTALLRRHSPHTAAPSQHSGFEGDASHRHTSTPRFRLAVFTWQLPAGTRRMEEQSEHTVHFCSYQVQRQAKLIWGKENQQSGSLCGVQMGKTLASMAVSTPCVSHLRGALLSCLLSV